MKFCSLYSGSSGNSMFIASENAKILIDAGLPGKKIDDALKSIGENPNEIDGIFVTHEHSDHIKGIGVLSRKYDIPIYSNADTWAVMEGNIGKIKEHNIR
ncbi:MBL fold metallo-hydrolase, partial [Clostridium perfringens]